MANNRVNVSLAFSADTKQARQAINDLEKSLNNLLRSNTNIDFGNQISGEIAKSKAAVAELQASLRNAVNMDTGKLDLGKFQDQLKRNGKELKDYQSALSNLGVEGDKAFSQIAYSIMTAEVPLRRSGKLVNDLWTTLKNTARWQISASIIQGFQGALQKAYGYAQDLNESLNNIRIVTSASVDDMARFAIEANKSAKALRTTTTEYTNASLIYYQQGLSDAEVKERTDVTIKMANVSRESAETVSDQMTAVWNNFADGSRTLEYYADVMTALGAATASSTAEITTGLEKFAAVAETVGLSYEYATTALATITDTTRQSADIVGNSLKTLFARIQGLSLGETLEDGTDLTKYSEALMKVGISIKEQDGSLRKMDDILDDMASKWGTLAKDQQVALAQTVAGVRQYTQLVALMDNWDKFQKNLIVAESAEGSLQKQADIYAESWEAASNKVTASLETIYQKLLNDEFLVDLTNGVADLIDKVGNLVDTFGGLPGILAIVGTAFNQIFRKQIISGVNDLSYNLQMLTPKGREKIIDKKYQAAHLLENLSINSDAQYGFGGAVGDAYKQVEMAEKDYLNVAQQLTQEQDKQYQILLKNQQLKMQDVVAAADELEAERATTQEIAEQMNMAIRDSIYFDPANNFSAKDIFTENTYLAWESDLKKTLNTLDLVQELTLQPPTPDNIKSVAEKIKQSLKDYDLLNGPLTASAYPHLDANVLAYLNNLRTVVQNIDNLTFDDLRRELEMLEQSSVESFSELRELLLTYGISEEQATTLINNLEQSYHRTTERAREFSDELNGLKQSSDAASEAHKKVTYQMMDAGTAAAYATSIISSLAMSFTSISGIVDTLNNKELTFFEKLATVGTSLIYIIPSVIDAYDKLKRMLNAKQVKDAGGAFSFLQGKIAGLVSSISAAATSFAPFLIALGIATAALAGFATVWKQWKDSQPEAQFERASQAVETLGQALSDANIKANELKSSIEGYTTARKALDDCVEGTQEWEDALKAANDAAMELLRNNPELYGTGKVSYEDGQIFIQEEAFNELEKIQAEKVNRLQLAENIANTNKRDAHIAVLESQFNKAIQGNNAILTADESALADRISNIIKQNGQITEYDLGQLKAENNVLWGDELNLYYDDLIAVLKELNNAITENTLATEIESENTVAKTLDGKYDDTVVKATAKTYTALIEAEEKKLVQDSKRELFEKYKLYDPKYANATIDKNTGQYTLNGQVIDLNEEIMRSTIVAARIANEGLIEQNAKEIQSIIGAGDKNNIYNNLLSDNTEALSNLELKSLDINKIQRLIDLGVLEDAVIEKINSIDIDPENITLEDTLSANVQQLFKQAFGDNWANGATGDLIEQVSIDLRDEFAQAVSQTNWSDIDSAQAFSDLLGELGVWLPEEEVEHFVQQMMDANDAVKQLDLEKFKTDFYDIKKLISELEKGDTISPEDYAKLTEAEREYFTLTSDGTYMLTEDAKKFYDTVMGNRLEDAKERITQLQDDIDGLETSATRFEYYGGDVDSLTSDQAGDILYQAGRLEEGMNLQERRNAVQQLITDYEEWQKTLNDTQAVLASMAEDETTLNKWLDEGKIDVEEYDKAMEVLRINQEKALKALNANVKGLEKSAPKITKALEAMNKGLDVDSPAFIEAINEVIEANPDLTGAVMSAYQTLTTAKVGTEEYTKAWNDLYQLLQHNASLNILEDNAEAARDAMEVLDDKTASVEERANALQNLNTLFGSEIFTDADKGVAALDNLRKALDGDKEAFKQLQEAVLEGILVKYNVGTGDIDLSKFEEGCIYAAALADDVREALIASGLFEIVETEMTVPALEKPEGLEKGDIIDGMVYDGSDDFYSFKEHKVKVQMIKPIGSGIGTRTMGTGSKSSGSKGTKKVSSDEKERYHVVNKQIEDLQAKYNEAGKIKDQAFGPAKESAALTELGYLDQLIEKERQYKAEIEQYLATDKSALAAYGATFGEHGEITNYDALMDKEIAKYNAAIEKAGTNQEKQEAAEKAYDLFIKALENYEGTYSAYLDKLATIQDLQNEKIDKELQNIQDGLDAKLDLEADQLKYLDYLIGKLDDEAFALADALVSLHDKTQPIMNQSDHYAQAWEELQRTAKENGGWTQDMIDKLRELRDGLISTNEEIMELQKTIEEKVNEAIAECTDELDKQINRFDTYQSILQNYNDIIDLSGEKFKDYAMMLELSSLMTDNAINKLASSREKLETLGQAQINAQAKLELAEDSGDQDVIDYWKKTLEDIQIEVENATAEMGSAWKEALQAASDAFESQVNLAIDNFKGGLEAFGDLDMISESYDRAEKAAERYLEDFEKTHELSQLGRDITKAMNDTASAFAKDELAELMAEVNEKQKDGVKMSEYDLEVLKKKFELKQAELALEEAQNSMSQVRLTRDNEGNWSYQYTADQDKVDEALNEYETRLYEVAKLSDEYIDEMSKAVIDNQKEMYETLAGLRAEDFASYEEYEAKVREIVNFYTTQDAYLRDELAKAVGDTEYVTTTMSGYYDNLSTSFTTVVDTMLGNTGDKTGNLKTWMESTDDLAEQAEEYFNTKLPEAYKTWEESIGEAMKAAGTSTEDFKDDVSGYMEDIGDASEELADDIGNAAEDMQDYIESVMNAVWDWQEEYSQAIQDMIDDNERLIESMMQVAAAQGAGGGNEPADYSLAIAELLAKGASINDPQILEWLEKRKAKDKEGKYLSNEDLMKVFEAYDDENHPKHKEAKELVKGVLEDGKWFTKEYLESFTFFKTGGYTGTWGPEGKMAVLHEKELILNSDDTVNFLAGVNILREIAKMIDLQAANMAMPHGFTLPMSASSGGALEQNVHISASFPGVQDRNEIEIALRSLVNEASQFVLE